MGRDPTKQYTSKPSKKAMKTAKKAFQKQREGAQQTIKQQTKAAKAGQGPYASSYKAKTIKQPTATKKTTLKDKLISGGRTLAEWKNIRDILSGNWLGVGKNVLGTIGANKLLGDQAYRGGDIQSWDEDDVSGIGSFNLADMGITTPGTDYNTQLAKVFGTMEDLKTIPGVTEEKFWGDDHKLTSGGEALGQFIEDAKLRQSKGKEQTGQTFYDWAKDQTGLYKGWKEHAPVIEGALKQGVLSETSDYGNQPNILKLKKDGGLINLFKYGGFLG